MGSTEFQPLGGTPTASLVEFRLLSNYVREQHHGSGCEVLSARISKFEELVANTIRGYHTE